MKSSLPKRPFAVAPEIMDLATVDVHSPALLDFNVERPVWSKSSVSCGSLCKALHNDPYA
jgi:hypothetical protein